MPADSILVNSHIESDVQISRTPGHNRWAPRRFSVRLRGALWLQPHIHLLSDLHAQRTELDMVLPGQVALEPRGGVCGSGE